ncbi:MAG: hypothetical protein QMD92_08360 [bacterium]|nr:hypothetical protein [bacterium]
MNIFLDTVDKIILKDPRYKYAAYQFVMVALGYTQKKFDKLYHVTGQDLLEGIKEYALNEFGPMTYEVFKHWGINSTDDFGNIVFNMVDFGLMGKTKEDSIEDFKEIYDLKKVFVDEYKMKLEK